MKPANGRKNEYQRRVSPIVRSGGRSSDIHIEIMKPKNTNNPMMVDVKARAALLRQAAQAPVAHSNTATIAK